MKVKVILSSLLVAACVVTSLSSCSKMSDKDYKTNIEFDKYDPPIELTTDRYIDDTDGLKAWEADPYIRWCEVNLGIKWKPKFLVASKKEHDQKLALLASTNDLPDVICDAPAYLVKEWYAGGFLRVLEDDINEWGSDLTKYVILDEYKKQSNNSGFAGFTTDEGKFYALPMVLDPSSGAWPRMFYREDILDELGMKEPTSIDELEKVLEAYKAAYKDNAALVLDDFLFTLANPVFQMHGSYANTFYEKDGEIVYGSLENTTKQALATLKEWYRKGYIAADFNTLKYETEQTNFADGKYFMVAGEQWYPRWMSAKLSEKKSQARITPLPLIKDRSGNVNKYMSNFNIQYPAVVTKNCKNPEAIIKEMNVLYESGLRNETDLREMGFEMRWAPTPQQQPENADEVATKGVKFAKYNYTKDQLGPHFLNNGPTITTAGPVGIMFGNTESRSVSSNKINYKDTLKTLEDNNYDMQATLNSLPELLRPWFDNTFISNKEAKGNQWGCAATLKNTDYIQTDVANKQAVNDGGWTYAYTGEASDDYFTALQDIERTYFVEIITGARPIDDFEKFVKEWKENGGTDILDQKNEMLKNTK